MVPLSIRFVELLVLNSTLQKNIAWLGRMCLKRTLLSKLVGGLSRKRSFQICTKAVVLTMILVLPHQEDFAKLIFKYFKSFTPRITIILVNPSTH